jgi:hypothetical protein
MVDPDSSGDVGGLHVDSGNEEDLISDVNYIEDGLPFT